MNELLEVLRIQGSRIGLKINFKRTKSLRLGISEDEKATLGSKRLIGWVASLISKDDGSSEDVKSLWLKVLFLS